MPTYYVSGGGSALQEALSSVSQTATTTHQLIVDDGVYTPINFLSSWFNTLKNKNFMISSRNGPENCIIDGGAVWQFDSTGFIWNATRLSGGARCIEGYQTSANSISCVGIGFRNAYASDSAVAYYSNQVNKRFYNCVFENIYCTGSRAIGRYATVNGCIFKNICGNRSTIANSGTLDKCSAEYITCSLVYEGAKIDRSILSHISCQNLGKYSTGFCNNLVYDLYFTNGFFSANQGDVRGNTIVTSEACRNKAVNIGNNDNQTNKIRRIDNNILVGNVKLYGAILTSRGISVQTNNNFCRSVNDVSCYNCIVGTDPGFLDEADYDFHLAGSSPCIAAGNYNLLEYSRDLDDRLYRNPPSMGAFQYYAPFIEGVLPHDPEPFGQKGRAPWSEILGQR